MEIQINDFPVKYKTPEVPPLKEIDGSNLPKKDQKWRRPILPNDKEAALLPKDERVKIIERELLRRVFGFWFMNNGEPTYITGSHYFYLTYWFLGALTDDGYAEYRKASRFRFYIRDLCDKDPDCYGLIMMTSKRQGKTEEALANIYNLATLIETDCLFGMQSLNATEAKNNLFKSRLMRSHKRIPNYLKPVSNESKGTKEIVSELTFLGQKVDGGTYKGALNNVIDWRPTITSAYQGKRPRWVFFDESGSLEEMDLEEWFTTVREQCALGKRIFGKIELPTTLETMEKKGAKSFQKIYEDSDYARKDKNGRTVSGLYRYLQPYYTGREGFIDEYGNDLEDEAKQFRQNQLENADIAGAQKIRRQYPENERDAFAYNDQHSPFDTIKIRAQLEFNKINPQVLKQGDFVWKDGQKFGKVEWHPHANGRFFCTWFPDPELRNAQAIKNGKVAPANELNGGFGLDSFSHKQVVSKQGSNCALYGILRPSMNRSYPYFFLEYLYRAQSPEEQADDVLKACIFYGFQVLGERNTPSVYNYFYHSGYENYLMDRPRDPWEVVNHNARKEKWLPNVSDEQRTDLVGHTMSYIKNHVGVNEETGNMGECFFDRLLNSWIDFDPSSRWTPYDSFVAAAYALTSIHRYTQPKAIQTFTPYIPKYDNSGTISRRL